MIHEDLSIVTDGIQQSEDDKLIHEHYLVPASQNDGDQFDTCCTTCGDCYCNNCGKLLVNKMIA